MLTGEYGQSAAYLFFDQQLDCLIIKNILPQAFAAGGSPS